MEETNIVDINNGKKIKNDTEDDTENHFELITFEETNFIKNEMQQSIDSLATLPKKNVVYGENVRFEFTAGFRKNSILIYLTDKKQLFTKKYAQGFHDRYMCYHKGCKASMLFDPSSNKIVKLYNTTHLHPNQSDVYNKMKVINEMKDFCVTAAKEGYDYTTKQIFDEKCGGANLVSYSRVKRNLNRIRKAAMSKSKNVSTTVVENKNKVLNKSAEEHSARVPSPVSSDAGSAASLTEDVVDASPTPDPSHTFTEVGKPMNFKKIKLTHEVPFIEGYLDEHTSQKVFEKRKPQIRRKSPIPPSRPRIAVRKDEGNHICSSCPCVAAMENEYDKIGKAWASELKMMTIEQQIFAKRAIAEILFEGQLGGLNRNTVQLQRTSENDPFIVEEHDYMLEKGEVDLNA